MTDRPIKNCYWVIPDQFLAGEYPRNSDNSSSQAKIDALLHAGVSAFIDLTRENDGLLPYAPLLEPHRLHGVTHQRFPIRDVSVPHSKEATLAILDAIDGHLQQGRTVYVHCWGGIGRTGLVVGCWLARHGYPGEAALTRLGDLWQQCPKSVSRRSPETVEQERYILTWREDPAQG
jgi:protein-tyrosine phosphatase